MFLLMYMLCTREVHQKSFFDRRFGYKHIILINGQRFLVHSQEINMCYRQSLIQNLINNFFPSNPSDLRNKKIHSFHLTLVK